MYLHCFFWSTFVSGYLVQKLFWMFVKAIEVTGFWQGFVLSGLGFQEMDCEKAENIFSVFYLLTVKSLSLFAVFFWGGEGARYLKCKSLTAIWVTACKPLPGT